MSNKKSYTYCELKTCPKDPSVQVLIRSFTKDDLFETAFFIGRTQVELHPFFINLNESVEYVTNFYINFLSTLIEDDLSVVAVYNNKIIGFIGGNDYCDKGKEKDAELLNERFSRLYNDWSAIFLVEETMDEFKLPNDFGKTAVISALVVDKEFNGKGIGTLLFDFINYHPKISKYQIYLAKIAAYGSKIISQKIGFVTLKTIKYEDFKTSNGIYPFKGIAEKLQKKGLGPENNFYSFSILKSNFNLKKMEFKNPFSIMETKTDKNIYSYYELKTCPKDPLTQILIRSFTKEDLLETASFIGRTQVDLHPFFINLNESIEYVTDFYKNILLTLIDDDLSVVAIYDSQIIGFIGGSDYCPKGKPDTYGLLAEKFPALCEQGSAIFMAEKNVEEFKKPDDFEKVAFVSALVVDKKFNGKGIGTLLFDFINYHPKISKFPIFLTEIAAFASKIISQKLGFVAVHTEKWENLKTPDGKYPYKGILEKLERKGLGKENDFYSFCVLKR